jgi:hypothetical protein
VVSWLSSRGNGGVREGQVLRGEQGGTDCKFVRVVANQEGPLFDDTILSRRPCLSRPLVEARGEPVGRIDGFLNKASLCTGRI